jgi:hypothetical protein
LEPLPPELLPPELLPPELLPPEELPPEELPPEELPPEELPPEELWPWFWLWLIEGVLLLATVPEVAPLTVAAMRAAHESGAITAPAMVR